MINKKLIMTMAISGMLITGAVQAAGSSNDLLRMDVKKSSAQDTVDVTFYTTGGVSNSVVSRKSGNSYVVLLPNVSGTQSVVPSLGGVKDLISNVTVKNIDDGIGGYTKVTFDTTKPVKIQTYTKQTAPLTQAQQDYKNLIAQNNTIKAVHKAQASQQQTTKPVNQTKTTSSTTKKAQQTKPAVKTTAPAAALSNVKPAVKQNSTTNQNKPVTATKPEPKTPITKTEKPKIETKTENKITEQNKQPSENPKEKIITNNSEIDNSKSISKTENKNTEANQKEVKSSAIPAASKVSIEQKIQNRIKNSKYNKPIVPIAGAFCIFGLFLLFGLSGIITRGVEDKRNRLKEYLDSNDSTQQPEEKKENAEFQEIMDDNESNWQEKYKRYADVNAKRRKIKSSDRMSYVADMASSKGVIVPDNMAETTNKMSETISKMEHSLAQTPSYEEPLYDMSSLWQSEDDAITDTMSKVKLKSFAKGINLTQTGRNLVSFEELEHRRKTLEESPYIHMEKTPLHMSKRKSASSKFNFANIVRGEDNNLDMQLNETKSSETKQRTDDYILSSINEYMSILENEKSQPVTASNSNPELERAEDISMALRNAEIELKNSKNLVTNPMISQRKSMLQKTQTSSVNGITIKSNFRIDSNKNIYMVDLENSSSIIGKIGEEVFVIKKFDRIINKSMQVRHDYGNTYIVRVGTFKCLVEVTEEKMGTLLEI